MGGFKMRLMVASILLLLLLPSVMGVTLSNTTISVSTESGEITGDKSVDSTSDDSLSEGSDSSGGSYFVDCYGDLCGVNEYCDVTSKSCTLVNDGAVVVDDESAVGDNDSRIRSDNGTGVLEEVLEEEVLEEDDAVNSSDGIIEEERGFPHAMVLGVLVLFVLGMLMYAFVLREKQEDKEESREEKDFRKALEER